MGCRLGCAMVVQTSILGATNLHARLDELLASHPAQDGPWGSLLIVADDIQAYVILHPPGTPNDTHYHEHDEWWVVVRGEINWHIEGEAEPIRAKAGDFVLCPSCATTTSSRSAASRPSAWRSTPAASS